jgi:pyruvate dehydrogenase E2 component (dihydrolipoamide acetyltransferase)
MAQAIVMPKLGQSEEEATILRWLKREGEPVAKGDVLFEIETDKAVLEVESFYQGTLLKILVPAGGAAPVQSVVAFVGQPGEAIAVPASGQTGRQDAGATPKISPRAARLATQHGIDPAEIKGSGPGGRIVERDVEAAVQGNVGATVAAATRPPAPQLPTGDHPGSPLREPLSRIRQIIAERTTASVRNAPHFFVTVSADVTDLLAMRQRLKAAGQAYTLNDFILKASAAALTEFPDFNSTTDGRNVWRHESVNLGMAVSLEGALVVPVIRNADRLGLKELHECAAALAEKARAGKLAPEEMSGGTFTVSNIGMLDVENFVAIINPPESAVLAVASAIRQPVVRNDQVVVRSMMKLTVVCDHRLIDGALAARFANSIRRKLENPGEWSGLE